MDEAEHRHHGVKEEKGGWWWSKKTTGKVHDVAEQELRIDLRACVVQRVRILDDVVDQVAAFSTVFETVAAARARRRARVAEAYEGLTEDSQRLLPRGELEAAMCIYRYEHKASAATGCHSVALDDDVTAEEYARAVDVALTVEGARNVVEAVRERVVHEVVFKNGYRELFIFLLSTLLLLLVVSAQRGFGGERTHMYSTIVDTMFGNTASVNTADSTVSGKVSDAMAFVDYQKTYIFDPIFEAEVCGDGVCQAPEEQPEFTASTDARVFEQSCRADCGLAATRKVRVEFGDIAKLWYAWKHMEAVLEDGWRGLTSERWGAAALLPVAGWNVCAQNLTRFGHFEEVCIFDGDVFIEGRAYRSAELDVNHASFGASYELELFEADWEVRIAYGNFEWPAVSGFGDPPKAFPAVGGRTCVEVTEGTLNALDSTVDSVTTWWGECVSWAPCADGEAPSCTCLFFDSEHVCFNEDGFKSFTQTAYNFAKDNALETLGGWWGVDPIEKIVTTYADVKEANNGTLDDDQWNIFDSSSELYRLTLEDISHPFDGWEVACVKIYVPGGDYEPVSCAFATGLDVVVVDLYLNSELDVVINVEQDCDSTSVSWSLAVASTGVVVKTGGDCIDNCAVFGGTDTLCVSDCDDFTLRPQACSSEDDDDWTQYVYDDDDDYPGPGPGGGRRLMAGPGSPVGGGAPTSVPGSSTPGGRRRRLMAGPGPPPPPTLEPTLEPTMEPTDEPTVSPFPTGVPTSVPSSVPTISPLPTGVPTSAPSQVPTSVPTSWPTNKANVFEADLRLAAVNNDYFQLTSTCKLSSLGDGVCDPANNNLFCAFDGGDCCADTCWIEDGDPYAYCPVTGESLDDSSCVSPVSTGSVTSTAEVCDFNVELSDFDESDGPGPGGDDDDLGPPSRRRRLAGDATPPEDCEPNWPYFVRGGSTEPAWHLKFPFSAYKAYRDVQRVRRGYRDLPHTEMPSLLCPDCGSANHLKDAYGAFKFSVNVTTEFLTIRGSTTYSEMDFLDEPPKRKRYFVKPNLVLIGPKITQQRYTTQACDAGETLFEGDEDGLEKSRCLADQSPPGKMPAGKRREWKDKRFDNDPFGTDPTFSTSSAIYRASNTAPDFYDASELRDNGLPFGFFQDQNDDSDVVHHYPCIFDVRLNVSRYEELVTYMVDGAYIDDQTKRLSTRMTLFNEETANIALVEMSVSAVEEGGFTFKWQVSIIDALLYDNFDDFVRLVFEVLWLCLLTVRILSELAEIYENRYSLLSYFGDWRNVVDIAAYAAMSSLVLHWVLHVQNCHDLKLRRYAEVYSNFNAVGRYFDAGPGLKDAIKMDADVIKVVDSAAAYNDAIAISIFIAVLQSLKNLDFHPKLGLTTSTIFVAGNDLVFFAILFMFIIFLFAVLGVLLFGTELESFSSTHRSIMALIDILFGDFGAIADQKNTASNLAVIVFFYSFIGISSLILLNALLAIIVDAYAVVKETSSKSLTPEIIGKLVRRVVLGKYVPPKPYFLTAEILQKSLEDRLIDCPKRHPPQAPAMLHKMGTERLNLADNARNKRLESLRVVFISVNSIIVALDHEMLRAAIHMVGTDDADASAISNEELLIYNIIEQQGVLAEDMDCRTELEQEAFIVLRELQTFSRFQRKLDPMMRLMLLFHLFVDSSSTPPASVDLKARLDLIESKLDALQPGKKHDVVLATSSSATLDATSLIYSREIAPEVPHQGPGEDQRPPALAPPTLVPPTSGN